MTFSRWRKCPLAGHKTIEQVAAAPPRSTWAVHFFKVDLHCSLALVVGQFRKLTYYRARYYSSGVELRYFPLTNLPMGYKVTISPKNECRQILKKIYESRGFFEFGPINQSEGVVSQ